MRKTKLLEASDLFFRNLRVVLIERQLLHAFTKISDQTTIQMRVQYQTQVCCHETVSQMSAIVRQRRSPVLPPRWIAADERDPASGRGADDVVATGTTN